MNESKDREYNVAMAWFTGKYDQEQAQLSAELQGIDFNRVKNEYGNIYSRSEEVANGY